MRRRKKTAFQEFQELLLDQWRKLRDRPDWPDILRRSAKTFAQAFFTIVTWDALKGNDAVSVVVNGLQAGAIAVGTIAWNAVQAWIFKR